MSNAIQWRSEWGRKCTPESGNVPRSSSSNSRASTADVGISSIPYSSSLSSSLCVTLVERVAKHGSLPTSITNRLWRVVVPRGEASLWGRELTGWNLVEQIVCSYSKIENISSSSHLPPLRSASILHHVTFRPLPFRYHTNTRKRPTRTFIPFVLYYLYSTRIKAKGRVSYVQKWI